MVCFSLVEVLLLLCPSIIISEAYILIITITISADSSDQNNIILSYEAAYIRQTIMYTTINQLMHQIQQSTNYTTIIHPWQSYKFSSTQLWSCCSAGSLSLTSQTAAVQISPHITVVHVMVFKVGQEWFSSAKPWTTLMNDLICLNCDMDDLPRCFMSAAFNRQNAGTLFSKSVPYLIGQANRRQLVCYTITITEHIILHDNLPLL